MAKRRSAGRTASADTGGSPAKLPKWPNSRIATRSSRRRTGSGGLSLEIAGLEGKPWGYVAGTRVGKRYVSYYLMPVYGSPALRATVSPKLEKRMQGKACFNFTTIDEELFAELAEVTRSGIKAYREAPATRPEVAAALTQTSR